MKKLIFILFLFTIVLITGQMNIKFVGSSENKEHCEDVKISAGAKKINQLIEHNILLNCEGNK